MATAEAVPKTTIYVDEEAGKDESAATGTQELPYRSLAYAYVHTQGTAEYLVKKAPGAPGTEEDAEPKGFQGAAKAALKKAANALKEFNKKAAKEKEQEVKRLKEEEARQLAYEEAKKIVVKEDPSLPAAKKISLDQTEGVVLKKTDGSVTGTRVRVVGRIHTIRKQKDVIFIELKDGYGKMQCVLSGLLAKTYDAITLVRETAIELRGTLTELPEGARAPLGRELQVDYFVIPTGGKAASGDDAINTRIAPDTEHSILLDLKHLTLRGDNASAVMIVRDQVEWAFNQTFKQLRFRKVSPPALVQTQVEGGSTLFKFDYYGEEAYLTQSSQLYLETCLASMGNVYCIEKSFRAEKSLTRRHLSEYTHVEGEMDFISFDDLLSTLEEIICRTIDLTLADPSIAAHIKRLNPEFTPPARPFMRMRYSDAITWLIEHEIPNEEGQPHQFGDDIAEAAERRMTDIINKPIFLTHFPVHIKAFYMQRDPDDPKVTESVDCLMPGVGEIVGGSMRLWDYEALMEGYKRENIDPKPYYWYTDQRRYGTSPHGGFGLGLERFLAWMCKLHTVRDACLYPRYMGRCTP